MNAKTSYGNTKLSPAHSEAEIAEMSDERKSRIRRHLLQESDRYKNIKCVKNGRKGMIVARDNARSNKAGKKKYEEDVVPTLKGEVDCLLMKVRYLEGSLYISEQKLANLRKENSNLTD